MLSLTCSLTAQENDYATSLVLMPDGTWQPATEVDPMNLITWNDADALVAYYTNLKAAQLFELEVMDVVDNTQEKLYTLKNRYERARENDDIYQLNQIRTDQEQVEKQLEDQEGQLQYVRSLIKDIHTIGSKRKFSKLAKIDIPSRYLNMARADLPIQTFVYGEADSEKSPQSPKEDVARVNPPKEKKEKVRRAVDRRPREKEVDAATPDQPGKKRGDTVRESRKRSKSAITKAKRDQKTDESKNRSDNKSVEKPQMHSMPEVANGGNYAPPNSTRTSDSDCEFSFSGTDQFSGDRRKDLSKEVLFTHTDPRLKAYMQGRDYVTAEGFLSSVSGGYRYLTLHIRIASKNARREYGYLRSSSLLNIRLLDGNIVSLFSQDSSTGTVDPLSGDLVYKVIYGIDYQKTKVLERSELDQIRIVWTSGYEDYPVYNVDFFTRQLGCLSQKEE